jgi:hypothetical protein
MLTACTHLDCLQEEAAPWQAEAGDGASTSGRTLQYIKDTKDVEITTPRLMLLADIKDPSTFTEVVFLGVAGDAITVIHKGKLKQSCTDLRL